MTTPRLKKNGEIMKDGHYVNLWQSGEERAEKYWLVRSAGYNPSWARKLRDWHLPRIEQFLGIDEIPITTA